MSTQFDAGNYPSHIVLVGAGGTGGQWARSIARLLWDMRARGLHIPSFTLIDPDRVEKKNVGRQLFSPADVGRYKAEVLAQRFGLALGLEIGAICEPFEMKMVGFDYRPVLICGAVDNHEARAAIHEVFGQGHRFIWIDAGNFSTAGQVVIGNATRERMAQAQVVEGQPWKYLPVATALFPALLEPDLEARPADDASCAELVEAGQQHLFVNDLMATIAASYTWKVMHRKPITSFVTYVDIDLMSARSLEITPENLEPYGITVQVQPAKPVKAGANGNGHRDPLWPARQIEGEDFGEPLDE